MMILDDPVLKRRILAVAAVLGALMMGITLALVVFNTRTTTTVYVPQPTAQSPASTAAAAPRVAQAPPPSTASPTTPPSTVRVPVAGAALTQADFSQACSEQHPGYSFARNDHNAGDPVAYRYKCYDSAGHLAPAPTFEDSGVSMASYCGAHGLTVQPPPNLWAPDALKQWKCVNP